MEVKSNKGITLIALIVTIIIILVIAAITVYEGSKLIDQAKYEDVKTNMLLLQAETKNYVEQAKFENKKIEDIVGEEKGITVDGKTLTFTEPESEISEKIEEIKNKTGADINLYQIKNIGELDLSNIDLKKYFIAIDIEEINVDVFFLPGILGEDGITHYFLSEID